MPAPALSSFDGANTQPSGNATVAPLRLGSRALSLNQSVFNNGCITSYGLFILAARFLRDWRIMDYSLLVGIQNVTERRVFHPAPQPAPRWALGLTRPQTPFTSGLDPLTVHRPNNPGIPGSLSPDR